MVFDQSDHTYYLSYFINTLEQVNTSVVKKKKKDLNEHDFEGEANCSGVVGFHCMQMSLVMSMLSIFGDD